MMNPDQLLNIVHIDIKDQSNPNSLIAKLPSQVATALLAIPDDVFLLGDDELIFKGKIDEMDKRLRYSLWYEYNLSIIGNRLMVNNNIFTGICRRWQWDRTYTNSFKLAFICTAPTSYRVATQEMLDLAQTQIRAILALDNFKPSKTGPVLNTAVLGYKIRIWEFLNQRVHGSFTQKVEIDSKVESKSVNVNLTNKGMDKNILDIDKRIKELESQANQLGVIDVKAKEREAIEASSESETLPEVWVKKLDGN
jgi:hypothetical protein